MEDFCEKVKMKRRAFADRAYNTLCRADDGFSSRRKLNIAVIAAVCVVLFALMLFLNYCTPYLNDD